MTLRLDSQVRRLAKKRGWLDQETGGFNQTAFLLRENEEELSVDLADLCSLDESIGRLNKCHGVVALSIKSIRELALDVRPDPLPDNPAHAGITDLPHVESDEGRALFLANALAETAGKLIWPVPR